MVTDALKKMVGRNIKMYREAKGWTGEELAKRLGYKSKTSISKIETGSELPREGKLRRIAEVLDVPFEEILNIKESNYGIYTILIKAYEDASEKERKAVCAVLDIPLIEVATPD